MSDNMRKGKQPKRKVYRTHKSARSTNPLSHEARRQQDSMSQEKDKRDFCCVLMLMLAHKKCEVTQKGR
jgi:hypothetical protein